MGLRVWEEGWCQEGGFQAQGTRERVSRQGSMRRRRTQMVKAQSEQQGQDKRVVGSEKEAETVLKKDKMRSFVQPF
jgi:hypothetical protein